MSLELADLGSVKVHQEVHCMLKAHALVNKQEMNALAREIIHEWAAKQFHAFSLAQELAKAKELPGITGDWK